ncbi:MAG: hypothetical protein H0V16_11525 [Burkholderiaceae bacterium]|nr:hypothetical protein [Burkholderiaceae bacterium]
MDKNLIEDNQTVEPEELDLRSHDIAEDKRQELLRLFPEILTEGSKIDFERLKLALGETVDVGKERYCMNWPGKADCFRAIQSLSLGTLRPCPEESVNFDTTENLIIEGDNLIRAMAARKPERVVCLDEGFRGNAIRIGITDQLKANAVQIFKTLHRGGDEAETSSDVTVFRTV